MPTKAKNKSTWSPLDPFNDRMMMSSKLRHHHQTRGSKPSNTMVITCMEAGGRLNCAWC